MDVVGWRREKGNLLKPVSRLLAFDEFGCGYCSRGAPNIHADCGNNYVEGSVGVGSRVWHCLLSLKSLGQEDREEAPSEDGSRSLSFETIAAGGKATEIKAKSGRHRGALLPGG